MAYKAEIGDSMEEMQIDKQPPTRIEIVEATKLMRNGKAAGMDGKK